MAIDDIHIVIDTREQTPWSFPAWVTCSIGTLSTGDYALSGDNGFAIERKSADDFAGTIASGWARFCRELNRMDEAEYPAKVIIVESDMIDFCFRTMNNEIIPPAHGHFRLTPQFIMKRVAELTLHRGASVIFAGNPDLASAVALSIFIERKNQLKEIEKNGVKRTN